MVQQGAIKQKKMQKCNRAHPLHQVCFPRRGTYLSVFHIHDCKKARMMTLEAKGISSWENIH